MKIRLPHTITSGGEKLTFERIIIRDGVEMLEGYAEVQPKAGPPMHIHYKQDEIFEVLSGKMAYQLADGVTRYAYPGDTVTAKAGVAHKFWNDGNDSLICRGYVTPPDNFVYFLSEIYKSINENKGGRLSLYDSAYLLTRYKSEYDMTEIPSFVKKFIFPVVLFFGTLLGKDKKFSGAPNPIL